MVSTNYHDITRLLLLTIIVINKNYTISIIGKGNITVNRQNRLIAHPYHKAGLTFGWLLLKSYFHPCNQLCSMYVCHTYIYIHMYPRVYGHKYRHTYVHVSTYVSTYIHASIRTYVYIRT